MFTANMIFRILTLVGLIGLVALVPLQIRARRRALAGITGQPPRLTLVERLLYLMLLVGVAILALTGLVAAVAWGGPMKEYLLILHVGSAPLFAIGIAGLALAWADQRQYTPHPTTQDVDSGTKILFWLMLLAGLVSILSAVIPMTPAIGSHGMHLAYHTHRYSSLALFILVVLHFFRFATS